MVVALIQFAQGASTPPAGQALMGVDGTVVDVTNGNDAGVVRWEYIWAYTPPGSDIEIGPAQEGTTPTYSFTPDVAGGFLLQLNTYDQAGNKATDYRCFGVPETSGRFIPPFMGDEESLNFGGQPFGWDPYLRAYLLEVDAGGGGAGGTPIVFRPGGSASGTVFSDLTELFAYAATLPEGPIEVFVDASQAEDPGTAVVPGVTYAIPADTKFTAYPLGAAITLEFADGTRMFSSSPLVPLGAMTAALRFRGLNVVSLANNSLGDSEPPALLVLEDSALSATSTAPFQTANQPLLVEAYGASVIGENAIWTTNQGATVNLHDRSSIQASAIFGLNAGLIINAEPGATVDPGLVGQGDVTINAISQFLPENPAAWGGATALTIKRALDLAAPSQASASSPIVFRPGGSASGTVFTDWPTLVTYLGTLPEGPVTIWLDPASQNPVTIPAGVYAMPRVLTLAGLPQGGNGYQGSLAFDDNGDVIFPGCVSLTISDFYEVNFYNSDIPLMEYGFNLELLRITTAFNNQGEVNVVGNPGSSGGSWVIRVQEAEVEGVIADSLSNVVSVFLEDQANLQAGCFPDCGAVISVSADATLDPSYLTQSGVTVVNASQYIPANPANFAGSPAQMTMQQAFDRISAAVAGLLGSPIP